MTVPQLGVFDGLAFCVGVVVLGLGFVNFVVFAFGIGREAGETLREWIKRLTSR